MTTIVWDGETLAYDKKATDTTPYIRTPEKDVEWIFMNERILGYGFIGDPLLTKGFEEMLRAPTASVETFVASLKQENKGKGDLKALVVTKDKNVHLVTYSNAGKNSSLGVLPGVGRTAIGDKATIAIACLAVGADCIKALSSCTDNDDHHEDSIVTGIF